MFSWLFGRKRDNPETSSEEQGHIDDCDEPATRIKKSVDKKPKSRSIKMILIYLQRVNSVKILKMKKETVLVIQKNDYE